MKRLANLKNSSSDPSHTNGTNKRNGAASVASKGKKEAKNNPYPLSGDAGSSSAERPNGHLSFTEPANSIRPSRLSQTEPYILDPTQENQLPTGRKSAAPTLSTNGDTTVSEAAYSKTGTVATANGGISTNGGGEGSTFSSPSPSVRSLTTTLTTVQSAAPSNQVYAAQNTTHYSPAVGGAGSHTTPHNSANQQIGIQFTHQFPTSPMTAVPSHLSPPTYTTATANNLLTDNASVLTLASSSKRRRRNSLDTNASVRALAPSSLFSGSRESLPLSVLSGNMGANNTGAGADQSNVSITNTAGILGRGGATNNERASLNSASGVLPADRGSVRSGLQPHHGRNDSINGSIGAQVAGSSITGVTGRMSRRSSGWGEIIDSEDTDDNQHEESEPSKRAEFDTSGNEEKETEKEKEKGNGN